MTTTDVDLTPEERAQARPYIEGLAATLDVGLSPESTEAEPGACDDCACEGERAHYGSVCVCRQCLHSRRRVAMSLTEVLPSVETASPPT